MKHERKNNLFKQVPVNRVRSNVFDLSHEVKMSGKFGFLYPVLCVDTLPGDVFRDSMQCMVRFAPLLAPVMHRVDVTTHFFFVPNRLLTDHWESFITGGRSGTEAPILPYITPAALQADGQADKMRKGELWDYLGLPVWDGVTPAAPSSEEQVSVLPFRAAGKVWNDYYRDPNFQDEFDLNLPQQGAESLGDFQAYTDMDSYRRAWEKDYFTSALEQAQRGDQVLIPLSAVGTIDESDIVYKAASEWYQADAGVPPAGNVQMGVLGGTSGVLLDSNIENLRVQNIDEINVDVSNAATTINDFRRAMAVQRWLEANARGGARYTEQILQHWDEQVPDYRLQRAEYLGGGKQAVVISEVLATAESENVPVGDMMGHGLSVGRTNRFSYRCKEHGFVVAFLSVVPRTAYQQGIPRMFSRQDKFDYAWPELANLGEQEILTKELYYSFDVADDPDNALLFGYIPRYSEYKFQVDRVAGDFRDTLSFWHLGRIFTSTPSLNENFTSMQENNIALAESYRRIFAVQDGTDYLWMQLFHSLTVKRKLPYFGVPSGLS